MTPKDFDTGSAIRVVGGGVSSDVKRAKVFFVTTRCSDPSTPDGVSDRDQLFRDRCWKDARDKIEMTQLSFGMSDAGAVMCGDATIVVSPISAPDASPAVSTMGTYECGHDYEKIRQAILKTPCRCALIFVHGYNTTFAFGIKRLAQLSVDLGYDGVPILFSSAAIGRFGDYINDTEAGELATPVLHQFLQAVARSDAQGDVNIDVIAHSMGTRHLLRAVGPDEAPKLRYVILAAPDIDVGGFLHLMPKVIPHLQRLVVYTSKYDIAMSASAAMHSNRERAGEGMSASLTADLAKTEFIDATARASDPYAHSYFAESNVILDDIRGVLAGTPATKRKRLICSPSGPQTSVSCVMPCPEGAKCGPSTYARLIHWLLD